MAITHADAVLLTCVLYSVGQSLITDLTGQWMMSNTHKGIKVPAWVPGSMYAALYLNKVISDPRYRDNDLKYRWIGRENWTFYRNFKVNESTFEMDSILLVCDGLDTFSSIYINDHKVGESENMYLQYTYNIKSALKIGNNTIRLDFQSAVNVARDRANASSYPVPEPCPPLFHGECHVNWIRKAPCSFAWDGGPSFPTQGVWRDIYIEAYKSAVIRELSIKVLRDSQEQWTLAISVYFNVSDTVVHGRLTTNVIGLPISVTHDLSFDSKGEHPSYSYTVTIHKDVPVQTWWPNGYGRQVLYTVNVTFCDVSAAREASSVQQRVGFRTVELVQNPVGNNQGFTFYFKINGQAIFLKGSNWVPADSFQEDVTRERLRRLLTSAAEVHMNVIRICGVGIYETDDFYELTDELGIMIWQDLMFSVALYPATPDFLRTVSQEISYQIRRLNHHPSLILWSGNNENELGFRQNWFGIHDFEKYYKDYVKLYVTTIKTIIDREDGSRPFVSSSPSDGKETEKEGWIAKNPNSQHFGDFHIYNYTADLWNVSSLLIPRFASEFGLQSWCDPETLEDVFDPEDLNYWGSMAEYRNHHPEGTVQMYNEMLQHFKEPNNPNTMQKFKDMIYLTQINQAVAMQTEVEHYRRWQNDLTPDGRGQTMGALYWVLHDIWQAPTWSSIDFKGKWKMLHYFARKFFAAVLVSPYFENNRLRVYLVVDGALRDVRDPQTGRTKFLHSTQTPGAAGTLYIQMYSWTKFTALKTWNITYKISKSSELVFSKDIDTLVSESGCPDRSSCFVYMYVTSVSNAYLPLTYYNKARGLDKARILITKVEKKSSTVFQVTMLSDHIAPFVWLDAYRIPGRFSDNGFLMSTPTRTVTFTSWLPVDLVVFKKSLSIRSLMDVYV